jgi:RNA-directed DNA polymerase
MRPLGIPTIRDRAMQALYLLALDPVAEVLADLSSFGFRKERSCADAIGQCFTLLAQRASVRWVLEGDIKSCFDRISHSWLLDHVPMDREILRKWLKAGYMEKDVLYATDDGTPQGGIISPVLANLALDGLAKELLGHFPKHGRRTRGDKVNLVRYADDFVITGSSRELLENEVKPVVERFLSERGLELSPEKTLVTHIEEGFDFLGQNVRKYGGKLLIKPSRKNVKTFLENLRTVVKANKQATAGNLVMLLNPKIRGWANYHRHVVSKAIFNRVDDAIFSLLWWWCKRRHPGKSRQWVRSKYFTTVGGNNWVFFGELKRMNGERRLVHLRRASQTPIRRHIPVRLDVNPYDPQWQEYLARRHAPGGSTKAAKGSADDGP